MKLLYRAALSVTACFIEIMRFGLDGLPLSELRTGVGHYTFELARALAAIEPDTNFALISPRRYLSLHSDEVVTPNLQFVREQVGVISKRWWTIGLPRYICLLYTSPSPRDRTRSRMPSSA